MKKNYHNSVSYQLNEKEECVALLKNLTQTTCQLFKSIARIAFNLDVIQKVCLAFRIFCVLFSTTYTLVLLFLIANIAAYVMGGITGTTTATLLALTKAGAYFIPVAGPIAFINLKKAF